MTFPSRFFAAVLSAALVLSADVTRSADDLLFLEEQAIQAAVERAAPTVVRIETVGGLEKVDRVLVGTGPTTGVIISDDGYIISSAFNFAQKPASILVTLPGGNRVAAELVATDHSRQLVLLKVTANEKLPVPEFVPGGEMRVGQWAIALGRTFEGDETNVSVGIISALDRIWSKAVQTDAKVSPSNYGGPLVDISGRMLGILVPLTPDGNSETAGVDWYDSGIGFAVPLEDVFQTLPRMKDGNDLHTGVLGINLAGNDLFGQPAKLAAVRPNSPAKKAGLKADDEIIEINGQKVARQAQLKHRLGPFYSGDKVRLAVQRGADRLEFEAELVDKLLPYERPQLGILPLRPVEGMAVAEGVTVREVLADSPAAAAGLARGDRVTSVNGTAVKDSPALDELLRELTVGDKLRLEVQRGDAKMTPELSLTAGTEVIPSDMPAAHAEPAQRDAGGAATGIVEIKVPEFSNECIAYVPTNYAPQIQYGAVIWIHPPGTQNRDELVDRWKEICAARDLILLAPRSADAARWQPSEAKFVRRALEELMKTHKVDRSRIVVHGEQTGGAMSFLLAMGNRDMIRGVAALHSALPGPMSPLEADPVNRLSFFLAAASLDAPAIKATAAKLRELKHPVIIEELGSERYLDEQELLRMVDWIDSLDRL